MPLPSARYAELLTEKIEKYNSNVYLINTGWIGGPTDWEKNKHSLYQSNRKRSFKGKLENV